ncbi:STAS domain-containing protein [Telmatospirillum sp.]|uniref:STAS domain-containing protein n=1 Tax=Telmatospirillum sp. TaxID=2079197 RepID=UPI00283BEF13|nr:STAS domain-containing protein [Telmatospirillum sp.]MDR3437985.1 STAS domain-containing protein [Telmatospirillum sp.]
MNDKNKIELTEYIDIHSAEQFHKRILYSLENYHDIEVDSESVAKIDVSIIQLLIAARASATRRGIALTMKHPVGDALLETLRRGGFLSEPLSANSDFWIIRS